jgi:hypothetical protein
MILHSITDFIVHARWYPNHIDRLQAWRELPHDDLFANMTIIESSTAPEVSHPQHAACDSSST